MGTKIHPLAVAGLALSVLGLLQCCTPFIAFLGLIFSSVAFFQIKTDPERYSGRGLALAGIITSVAGVLVFWILLSTGIIDELMKNLPKINVP
ncbi:MAG: DUF4190 domain-containing protein [Verrucomicrobia bacterium]|nr:DUF4190 domain-containing protein [Verrucomicrobiota bacterium]